MASTPIRRVQQALLWAATGLGVLTLAMVAATVAPESPEQIAARLLPAHMRGQVPWKTIETDALEEGRSVPANTNVILKFPEDMPPTTRRVALGYRGTDVRYWGYCFPEDYDRANAVRQSGFPGTIFLSEKERAGRRRQQQNLRAERFSAERDLTEEDLNEERYFRGIIRHQQDVFQPGTACYLMTEAPLPVGTDRDGDFANSAVERDAQTDPQNPDTDADGISDGIELFYLKTIPTLRDSDGDGIIDGIEDANRNGRVDPGETDATLWDTDRDGLCDGLCKVERGKKLRGEDKNINGVLDAGEYDPLLEDTDGDGILDQHEVYLCELENGTDC